MITTPNMGLTVWNLTTDVFDHSQLANTISAIDLHEHSNGKGVQIGTGGIADGAITTSKLGAAAVNLSKLAVGAARFSFVNATTTRSATDGQFLSCAPSVTITLTPVQNATIGIVANSSVTGTTTVTVGAGGGVIFGLGLSGSGVASVTLGSPSAHLVLYCYDATNWVIISGQQDTGWVAIPPPGGYLTATGYYTPATRLIGDMVLMRGMHDNGSGTPSGYSTTLGSPFHPAKTASLQPLLTSVTTSGGISLSTSNGVTDFDNVRYSIA